MIVKSKEAIFTCHEKSIVVSSTLKKPSKNYTCFISRCFGLFLIHLQSKKIIITRWNALWVWHLEFDTFEFLRIIADHELDRKRIMCSFDVKSPFTNIPVDFTVNLILDKVFADKKNKFHGLSRTELRKMLNWTCKNTVLQFNGKYYTQLDGVATGSPIAPMMADVFMNWLVDNVSKIGCSPHILCRCVDDIFCAFDSKDEMDKFFQNLTKCIQA